MADLDHVHITALDVRNARVRAHDAHLAEFDAACNLMENFDDAKREHLERRVKLTTTYAAQCWLEYEKVCAAHALNEIRRLGDEIVVEVAEGIFEVQPEQ